MAAASAAAPVSKLTSFRLNGVPLGETTAAQALAWAASQQRDVEFVRRLAANLPPHEPIGKYRTPQEADAIYAEVEAERRRNV